VLISPRFGPEKIQTGRIEDFIDVYEDRLKGWMLDRADEMARHPHGEFAALAIAMSYFEPHWSFVTGEDSDGQSGDFFRSGYRAVFPNPQPTASMGNTPLPADLEARQAQSVYIRARNGLFHSGMARSGILIARYPEAVRVSINLDTGEIGAVVFNVPRVLATIRHHLDQFLTKVRDANERDARDKFQAAWRLSHAGEIIHLPPDYMTDINADAPARPAGTAAPAAGASGAPAPSAPGT
jgi:hypothetical protein